MSSKKIEAKDEAPLRLYIEYDEDREGGEPDDPEDRWTSHSDVNVTVRFIRLHREQPKNRFFCDSVELPNKKMAKMKTLFLAVVRYGTGDTFGHTNGAWYVAGIAPTYKIAQAILDEESKPSDTGYSKRWEGYFESLQDTEIHELIVV